MKKFLVAGLAVAVLATSSSVMADEREGKLRLYYAQHTSTLDAPTLTADLKPWTGKDAYENDGDYWGFFFSLPLKYKRLGVAGNYIHGSSDRIENGDFTAEDFDSTQPAAANANPLTYEKVRILDVSATLTLFAFDKNGHSGGVDAAFGYFLLDSKPTTSAGNAYSGAALGLNAFYRWQKGIHEIGLDGRFNYIPSHVVRGNVEGGLDDRYIYQYRIGVEYAVYEHYGITAGYQGLRLKGKVYDWTNAVLTFNGFFAGLLFKY